MRLIQAVILAGGRGTRLKPFTNGNHKCMVDINGKPFLWYLIDLLSKNDIKEIFVLTGYQSDKIMDYFKNHQFRDRLRYSYLPLFNKKGEEIKSNLRIKKIESFLDNYFLVLYCDNYWPLPLDELKKHYLQSGKEVQMTISTGNLDHIREIGFIIVSKKLVKKLPKTNVPFEFLIKKTNPALYFSQEKYYSIADPERLEVIRRYLK